MRMAQTLWIARTIFSLVNSAVNSLSNTPRFLEQQFLEQSNDFLYTNYLFKLELKLKKNVIIECVEYISSTF
jgi:hypothetical protein